MNEQVKQTLNAIDKTAKAFETLFSDIIRKEPENASTENRRPDSASEE